MSTHDSDYGTTYNDPGNPRDDDPVTHEEHVSRFFHRMGEVLPYADGIEANVSGSRSVGQSEYVAASDHTHHFRSALLASGSVTDAGVFGASDVPQTEWVGSQALRLSDDTFWVRTNAGWRKTSLATVSPPRVVPGGSVLGGTPPNPGEYFIQAGSSVQTLGFGAMSITFPITWPNGILSIVCGQGDTGAGGAIMNGVQMSSISLSSFIVIVYKHDGAGDTGARRINWQAIGW